MLEGLQTQIFGMAYLPGSHLGMGSREGADPRGAEKLSLATLGISVLQSDTWALPLAAVWLCAIYFTSLSPWAEKYRPAFLFFKATSIHLIPLKKNVA